MLRNQSNKLFLELMVKSGVSFFTKNQPNNYYIVQKKIETESKLSNNLQLEDIVTIKELSNYINRSDKCLLKNSAKKTVIADGNPASKLMIIGEAPGVEEDKMGKPFVGEAGKLLDKMLNFIFLSRSKNFYITNIVFWRPPGNRTPNNQEINVCLPYVKEHINIISPQLIILLGNIAAKSLLQTDQGITKIRGKKFFYFDNENNLKIETVPIFHPAYLLRNPIEKKHIWEDLKNIYEIIKKKEIL